MQGWLFVNDPTFWTPGKYKEALPPFIRRYIWCGSAQSCRTLESTLDNGTTGKNGHTRLGRGELSCLQQDSIVLRAAVYLVHVAELRWRWGSVRAFHGGQRCRFLKHRRLIAESIFRREKLQYFIKTYLTSWLIPFNSGTRVSTELQRLDDHWCRSHTGRNKPKWNYFRVHEWNELEDCSGRSRFLVCSNLEIFCLKLRLLVCSTHKYMHVKSKMFVYYTFRVARFTDRRYGAVSLEAHSAYGILRKTVFDHPTTWANHGGYTVTQRPSLTLQEPVSVNEYTALIAQKECQIVNILRTFFRMFLIREKQSFQRWMNLCS